MEDGEGRLEFGCGHGGGVEGGGGAEAGVEGEAC